MDSDVRKECIFCRIADHDIPTDLIYEDEQVVAFADLNPLAPVHILIIPRKHMACLNEAAAEDEALLGHINIVAAQLAEKMGLAASGWRLVNNCGKDAGQEVFHLHYHLLGGRWLGPFTQK